MRLNHAHCGSTGYKSENENTLVFIMVKIEYEYEPPIHSDSYLDNYPNSTEKNH